MAGRSELTPELLTKLMAEHTGGATVDSVRAEPVGTGQMAICLRLDLEYGTEGAGPASVIAKLPSVDPASRDAAKALRCYEIEVSFYRELHSLLDVSTPRVYHADLDVDETDFLLLMEDVAPARQGDQLAGCTFEQAAAAVVELAGLHAPLWGQTRLEAIDWLHRNTEATAGSLSALVRMLYPGFLERYAERLTPGIRQASDRLVEGMDGYERNRPGPWTVTHGDFRLDNLLFTDAKPEIDVFVVDWQTAVLGPGVSDLSYFLGSAFHPEQRRAYEEDLVRAYHDQLGGSGVEISWSDLWSQYRRFAFGGLIMAIVASMLVQRTPRGDDMFMTMAHRHGQHAIDLEATEFLSG
jgi:aminoglycoside/choline kinase family phosphotransferase